MDILVKCTDCSFLLSLDLVVVFTILFYSDYNKVYSLFFKMDIQVLFSHILYCFATFCKTPLFFLGYYYLYQLCN